jgi:NAD(P)-dependent dehydrogenase (short-subunit alcohol dehydrogenase family)
MRHLDERGVNGGLPAPDVERPDAMKEKSRTAIVLSASSDIGGAIAGRWLARGWKVSGTYRTPSAEVDALVAAGARLVSCDLADPASIAEASAKLADECGKWDALFMCPGALDPIGAFIDCDFDEWERSVTVNFTRQMRLFHSLATSRRLDSPLGPCVVFFAGGGTNDAPVNYSAYIISKIALTKMCELLDAETPDTRFVIVGPGWVNTKIHRATLTAGQRAGTNYRRTVEKLSGAECTPMERLLDCCEWLVKAPREMIGGRNFSVVFDRWGTDELALRLKERPHMYKLRRQGNEWPIGSGE